MLLITTYKKAFYLKCFVLKNTFRGVPFYQSFENSFRTSIIILQGVFKTISKNYHLKG